MQLSEKKMHLDTGSDCKWSQALEEPGQECTYRERPGAALLAQGSSPAQGHRDRTVLLEMSVICLDFVDHMLLNIHSP